MPNAAVEEGGQKGRRRPPRLFAGVVRWSGLLCVPGGVLWALSPLGVYFSEMRFGTPNVFWKLFSSAPLLLLVGLVGLYFGRLPGRSSSSLLLPRLAFFVTLFGLLLVVAGNVGQFWLGVDDLYIMTAPAYYSFRLGLVVVGAGTMLLGVTVAREEVLPVWGALPLAIGGLCGLVAFVRDLGTFGVALWILFGAGWAWLGVALLVEGVASLWRARRASS